MKMLQIKEMPESDYLCNHKQTLFYVSFYETI